MKARHIVLARGRRARRGGAFRPGPVGHEHRPQAGAQPAAAAANEFYDSHFHLTNYIQEGIDARQFLEIMGNRVGRSTLFGIPLQQQWSYGNSGDFAPTYYLQSDAPLYYYSFTDAYIATPYRSLAPEQQARFDPMITGFNPADMYGVDHIRRVLETFPGVFSGIGEFSIHKEFVSAKVAGETASLTNPALDRILDFAGEAGLVVILHNDIDMPFAKTDAEPVYLAQMKALFKRHPKTTIIWAHVGLGRIVHPCRCRPSRPSGAASGDRRDDADRPGAQHVMFDISWDEVAKYAVASPESIERVAAILNRYPDRFLFGTDTVAPSGPARTTPSSTCGRPSGAADAGGEPEGAQGQLRTTFRRSPRRVRAWERANAVGEFVSRGEAVKRRHASRRAGSILALAALLALGTASNDVARTAGR